MPTPSGGTEGCARVHAFFDATASSYDRTRRQLIPCFDDYYRMAVEQLPFPADAPIEVLDLGAGTGLMAAFVAAAFPRATITLLDASSAMLDHARIRFADETDRIRYLTLDYTAAPLPGRYDAIVSALSIHHLADDEKRALFHQIRASLVSGGVFVNADQVLGPTPALERRYREAWLHAVQRSGIDADDLALAIERTKLDRMSTLADQLSWLAEAGFRDVDCWYKYYSFVVFGGTAS